MDDLTVSECAQRHGVTRAAIYAAIQRGDIACVVRDGKRYVSAHACSSYRPKLDRATRARRSEAPPSKLAPGIPANTPQELDEADDLDRTAPDTDYLHQLRAAYDEAVADYSSCWLTLDDSIREAVRCLPTVGTTADLIAKLWLIAAGRVWTSGAETDERERSAIERVAKDLHHRHDEVEAILGRLKDLDRLEGLESVRMVVHAHHDLFEIISGAGLGMQRARSLASWYLHYHAPAVPIHDAASAGKLRRMLGWHPDLHDINLPEGADDEYAWYVQSTAKLREYLNSTIDVPKPKVASGLQLQMQPHNAHDPSLKAAEHETTSRPLHFFLTRSAAREPYELRELFIGGGLPWIPVMERIWRWRKQLAESEAKITLQYWPQPFVNLHAVGRGSELDHIRLREQLDKVRKSIDQLPLTIELRGIAVCHRAHDRGSALRWRCTADTVERLRDLERELVRNLELPPDVSRWGADTDERRWGISLGSNAEVSPEVVREHLWVDGPETRATFQITSDDLDVWRKRGGTGAAKPAETDAASRGGSAPGAGTSLPGRAR